MAHFRGKSPQFLQARIDFLENQRLLGVKSIQSAEGSTTLLSFEEAGKLIDDLYDALDLANNVPKAPEKQAVFGVISLYQRPC